ncbi:MAG: DUF1788 domain-containing protein [Bacteroidales bacterium]|nr:DUF1788 domain-containing protein [Bacteroidales bacterium]
MSRITELYEHLNSPEFQNTEGNIFYNYYIYQYPADKEYEMRRDIQDFKKRLERPNSYVNAMLLDLFDVFCDYLKKERFGNDSLFDDTLKEDQIRPEYVTAELTSDANSDRFIEYIHERINDHLKINDGLHKPYIFVYGVGKIFPYLRTNVFLTKYEKYNEPNLYKIILFYPGHQVGNSFSLFDSLEDTHTYRAILLINKQN